MHSMFFSHWLKSFGPFLCVLKVLYTCNSAICVLWHLIGVSIILTAVLYVCYTLLQ